ncbi:MAG: glycoside hydrolase family 32 protein [Anaerolineae bacterium]|nr:glycoside hydrolase family 32 protein [Anaerolineae bacterium]
MDLRHRPRYHFTSLANFMNDPTGLIQWKGRYHLFYQHNPHGAVSLNKHKGHAVSDDLVHWVHLPIALAPTPGGYDQAHTATGCVVDNRGTPTFVYTGFASLDPLIESQCLATSPDDLLTWQKHPANPVISAPPPGLDVTGFRDPCVWQEDGTWYMALGSGLRGLGGAVLLYRSPDLLQWEYLQPILVGDPAESGTIWECPNLFPLDGRHVLIVSHLPARQCLYFSGTYASYRLVPEAKGVVDWGHCFYAPQTFQDDRGRRIMFGWLQEGRGREAQEAAGWSGVMSLPQVLSLDAGGTLVGRPAPEVEALRGRHFRLVDLALGAGVQVLPEVRGEHLEILATIEPGGADALGLLVRRSPGGEEETLIVYDRARASLAIDRRRSSLEGEAARDVREAPLALAEGEPLELRIFLDGSVLEVFAGHGVYIAGRIYPGRADSLGVALFAEGGPARASLDVWEMESIWQRYV